MGDLVWIPPRDGIAGNCGIVTAISERSLFVLFPELGSELELAHGWFAPIPVSGSLVPGWPEFDIEPGDRGVTYDG